MPHELPDYYTMLGVASTASPAQLAHAYRARVRGQHPDAHPDLAAGTRQDGGSDGLRDVIAAYAVLRDPVQRADYDRRRQLAADLPPPNPHAEMVARPRRMSPLRVGPVRYHGPPRRQHP